MIDFRGKRTIFRKSQPRSNPFRIFLLLLLILAGAFLLRGYSTGAVKPLMAVTPTPTRIQDSYALEGETHFIAGNLAKAIDAYKAATRVNPDDASLWYELARIQTYSREQLTTTEERRQRMLEALESSERAVELAPEDSNAHAIRSFVLDWYASPLLAGEEWEKYLVEAEQEAVKAIQLDGSNALAMAYYAEILIDQLKYSQATQYISQALEKGPDLMDVHRVNGFIQESMGNYAQAINEYTRAAEITPNLTSLYVAIGLNYRQLGIKTPKYYENALENFARAAGINEQLGIKDPLPMIAIAKTYVQLGEFLAASRNILKAVQYEPNTPEVYGQLGIVYFQARNYEGSIPALKCAVLGCDASESCQVRNWGEVCDPEEIRDIVIKGMPLDDTTVVYYYTYGAVLAGMHRASNGYCGEAMEILNTVRSKYESDENIMAIVGESETICKSYGY